MRGRAFRRAAHAKAIAKTRKHIWSIWDWIEYDKKHGTDVYEQSVRRRAENRKICSCYMCGNPRRYYGQRTVKENQFLAEPIEIEEEFDC